MLAGSTRDHGDNGVGGSGGGGVGFALSQLLIPGALVGVVAMSTQQRLDARAAAKDLFYHAYDAYMKYAFPHDELKPLTRSYTDSLIELGNAKPTATQVRVAQRCIAVVIISLFVALALFILLTYVSTSLFIAPAGDIQGCCTDAH
jgi:hypothetical protein